VFYQAHAQAASRNGLEISNGFYKLRVGDYRVVYEFDQAIRVITVDRVGHRSEIYE
jgi:mRNA-degrading endonuclease RelE of RelBE toxin-antitoxin system